MNIFIEKFNALKLNYLFIFKGKCNNFIIIKNCSCCFKYIHRFVNIHNRIIRVTIIHFLIYRFWNG